MRPEETKPAANIEPAEELEAAEVVAEPTETPEAAEPEPETATQQEAAATINKAEFEKLHAEFGAEIASQVVLTGGGMAEAYKLKAEAAEKRAAELEAALAAKSGGGSPAKPSEGDGKKRSIWS